MSVKHRIISFLSMESSEEETDDDDNLSSDIYKNKSTNLNAYPNGNPNSRKTKQSNNSFKEVNFEDNQNLTRDKGNNTGVNFNENVNPNKKLEVSNLPNNTTLVFSKEDIEKELGKEIEWENGTEANLDTFPDIEPGKEIVRVKLNVINTDISTIDNKDVCANIVNPCQNGIHLGNEEYPLKNDNLKLKNSKPGSSSNNHEKTLLEENSASSNFFLSLVSHPVQRNVERKDGIFLEENQNTVKSQVAPRFRKSKLRVIQLTEKKKSSKRNKANKTSNVNNATTLKTYKKKTGAEHKTIKEKNFKCKKCLKSFTQKINLEFHDIAKHSKERKIKCGRKGCKWTGVKSSDKKRHIESKHKKVRFHCGHCNKHFSALYTTKKHIRKSHKNLSENVYKMVNGVRVD